jgi:hypothetical protein
MEPDKNEQARILAQIWEILGRIVKDGLSPMEYAPLLATIASLADKLPGPEHGIFLKLPRNERDLLRDLATRLVDFKTEQLRHLATGTVSNPELEAYREFIERLLNRQGTILPDFESLYDRKADLDAKFFGPGSSGEQAP